MNYGVKKQIEKEQALLKASKTKEDLNEIFKGKTIIVNDGSDWQDARCEFVEMVGEGERKNWKMKVKTSFGTFIELEGGKAIIVARTITTTEKYVDEVANDVKKEFDKPPIKKDFEGL